MIVLKIKLNTEISDNYEELEITLHTNKLTEQVQQIINLLQNFDNTLNKIVGTKNNDIFLISTQDIICFYSENKNNYLRTNNGAFKIKHTLHELEEKLSPTDFVRISNSSIININHVECFNTEIIGTIKVKFKDGTVDYVSRRKISQVMKTLKGGK